MDETEIRERTRAWIEKAVIGLNLCPFAKAVHVGGRLRIAVSGVTSAKELLEDLERELRALVATGPEVVETTLLVHPLVLVDFLDFNDFLAEAEALLADLDLEGVVQLAHFHPRYQFAGTAVDDVSNFTNRSPYPTLHLLRESSVSRAVDSMADTDAIYRANIATLRKLGVAGWRALGLTSPEAS